MTPAASRSADVVPALARTRLVREVMTAQPHTIGVDQPLAVAHRMMKSYGVRHLPVLDRAHVVGVLSERDLFFLETGADVDARYERVDQAMSTNVHAVPPETPLAEVARTMADRKLGCTVVVEGARVVGIFTAIDALRLLADG